MVFNTLMPICLIVLLGVMLKKSRFIDNNFIDAAIDIIHLFLLPIVIFWTIAGGSNPVSFKWEVYLSVFLSMIIVFCAGQVYISIGKTEKKNALVFSMSCYRSNVGLGLALTYYLFDQSVFYDFCIFLLIIIPVTDVMTITSTAWLLEDGKTKKNIARSLLKLISFNPIVIAGGLGIILSDSDISFPVFVTNFFNLVYPATFPLALLLTGAMLCQFGATNISRPAVIGATLKTIILPLSWYLLINIFSVDGEIIGVIILFLSLPYMLDRKIPSAKYSMQMEIIRPFYALSSVFSFTVLSTVLLLLY